MFLTCIFLYCFIINQTVKNPSKYKENETQFVGIIQKIQIEENKITMTVKAKEKLIVYAEIPSKESPSYQVGEKIKIEGSLIEPSTNRNFYLFSYKNYLKSQKIYWTVKASSITKLKKPNWFYKIKNIIQNRIHTFQNKAYFQAFLLGNTNKIEESILESYQINGISHLFAISGMHIGFITAILAKIVKKIPFSFFIILGILSLYIFLTDFSPSVIRASFMFLGTYWCKQNHKSIKSIDLCILIAGLSLLYNPYWIYAINFQYSYIITIFLLGYQKKLQNQSYWKKLFLISFLAFLVGLPISIQQNFQINILSMFYNMFFVPFVSFWIFPLIWICFLCPILEHILTLSLFLLETISYQLSTISIGIIPFGHLSILKIILYYSLLILFLYKKQTFSKFIYIIFF